MGRQIPDCLTEKELEQVFSVPNLTTPSGLRNRAMLDLMAQGGLRSKEIVGLKTTDVREEEEQVVLHLRETKGGKNRRIPLAPRSAELLLLWLAKRRAMGIRTRHVFCTISTGQRRAGFSKDPELRRGEPISDRYLREFVARCGEQAGIERRLHPHLLRHTYASRLLRHCRNVRVVQTALGHSSLTTTQIYTHVLNDELTEAMATLPEP
jgi:site-specific recombinase XerD